MTKIAVVHYTFSRTTAFASLGKNVIMQTRQYLFFLKVQFSQATLRDPIYSAYITERYYYEGTNYVKPDSYLKVLVL